MILCDLELYNSLTSIRSFLTKKALRKSGRLVSKNLFFVVGDGQRIKFWKNRW